MVGCNPGKALLCKTDVGVLRSIQQKSQKRGDSLRGLPVRSEILVTKCVLSQTYGCKLVKNCVLFNKLVTFCIENKKKIWATNLYFFFPIKNSRKKIEESLVRSGLKT